MSTRKPSEAQRRVLEWLRKNEYASVLDSGSFDVVRVVCPPGYTTAPPPINRAMFDNFVWIGWLEHAMETTSTHRFYRLSDAGREAIS